MRRAIRATGARLLFLPPYSLDLNPIDPSAGSGGLRQTETSHAKGQGANRRYLETPRLIARNLQTLHRCLQRHGINRLPEVEGDKAKKQKFATYPIGYFHIDIVEVQTEDGKLYMFVAVDRTSKFAYAELHPRATRIIAKDFLDNLTKAVPYKIHTVLTDNGIQFTKREGTEA